MLLQYFHHHGRFVGFFFNAELYQPKEFIVCQLLRSSVTCDITDVTVLHRKKNIENVFARYQKTL